MDTIDSLYTKYNALLNENDYGSKYDLGNVQMFVIEGMDKVRDVIAKNRSRKLTKYKTLSNNTIELVDGKGKRKPEIQQLYEELEHWGRRLMGYKECFEIMRKDRNSYSKTDLEAVSTDYNTLIPVL